MRTVVLPIDAMACINAPFRLAHPPTSLTAWSAPAAGVAPVFEIGDGDADRAGTVEVWFDGALALAREQTRALDWGRTPSAIRSAPFDGVLVQVLDGDGRLDLPRSNISAFGSGDVVVLDMNRPFHLRVEVAREAAHVGLWIPASRLPDTLAGAELHGLRLANVSPAGAMLGASLRALAERAGAMREADFHALTGGFVDLLGRILRREVQNARRADAALPLDTFVTVRRFVDRNLTSPKLGPLTVTRSLGLSRASIYRLFEPVDGLAGYIRARRLQRAYDEITAPALADRRVGAIAFALGFRNFSSFSRLFNKTYKMTPTQARRAALSSLVVKPDGRSVDNLSCNLYNVLAHLRVQ